MGSDTHALSGAYALDALDPEEAARFEHHLEGCDTCRAEVAEFREVAARLGARAAESPPTGLRDKVLSQADRTRQEPPPTGSSAARTARTARRRRWAGGLLAAAVAVVVAGVVGVQLTEDGETPPPPPGPALAEPAVEVFEAEDAEAVEVQTRNGGMLRVAVSHDRGEMAVDVRELPDPGPGRVYQIWTGHGDEMVSAGMLSADDTGAAMEMPEPGVTVNFTVEPAGGSEQPTSRPIATVEPAAL